MRTLSLILYFLFAGHGLGNEAESLAQSCDDQSGQESHHAYVELGENFFSKLSKRHSKNINKQSQNKTFEAFLNRASHLKFSLTSESNASKCVDNKPKVNPGIMEHTFFNNLFFPPDLDGDTFKV